MNKWLEKFSESARDRTPAKDDFLRTQERRPRFLHRDSSRRGLNHCVSPVRTHVCIRMVARALGEPHPYI
jgi:hypothetical protein